MGKDIPLSGIFDDKHPRHGEAGEIRALYEAEAEVKQVLDTARGLEGLIRQAWRARGRGDHEQRAAHRPHPGLAARADWAHHHPVRLPGRARISACSRWTSSGLRNLTVLEDAVAGIKANRDEQVELERLQLDDKPTYELLARGDTLGVFQLDGGPMRALLRSMRADRFEDIVAVNALYRPAPWARTRTTSMPTARPAASRSRLSTRSWPSRWPGSWAIPTG
jgi:DNA polymerase-3 subunit alpha